MANITDVKLGANFFISQNILVSTSTETHKFVVYHAKEWIEKIKDSMVNIDKCQGDNSADYTVELRKLKSLLDDGIITKEEYDIKKRTILGI